ncbi:MAG: 50S ribosome-binding GTPase, partial [Nocardioides sp.]|uniref:HflX GTPase family protein n=1 Tax=Nocardioides sp. TaxID=35761 RepID=UPI002384521C
APIYAHGVHLRVLNLTENRLTMVPASVRGMARLEQLHLRNNKLVSVDAALIALEGKLRCINLSDNGDTLLQPPAPYACGFGGDSSNSDDAFPDDDGEFIADETLAALFRYFHESKRPYFRVKLVLVGDGHAGKTSLLNRLPGAGVLVVDSLFATLDPTTRRTTTADGRIYTMSDTVGFVRHLPHQLIEAFRSTLEEVADADLIVHVVDGSHPDPEGQLSAVREVLAEIEASDVRELVVINKADAADPLVLARLQRAEPHSVVVSARTGAGIAEAIALVEGELPRPGVAFHALLPYERGDLINRLHQEGEIDLLEHTAEGSIVKGRANEDLAGELAGYSV